MSESPRWANPDYEALERVLRSRSGLVFQPQRRQSVEAAAHRVMQRVGIRSPHDFIPIVAQHGAVFDDLMAEVTIGETYFFREPAHFTLLRTAIVPEFQRRANPHQKFRAWSAGCATGEEPYSIAIALREEGVPADVIGTDVSRERLSAARRGEYREWSFRGVPNAMIRHYFRHEDDRFTLAADIRRQVEFRYLNLASDCYPELSSGVWGLDLILCRNVLIYFDRDMMAHVARSLLASLADDGWLLLGAADPPLQELAECEVVEGGDTIAYRHFKGMRRLLTQPIRHIPPLLDAPAAPAQPITLPVTPSVEPQPPATPRLEHEVASSGIARADMGQQREALDTSPAAAAYATRDYERVTEMLASLVTGRAASASDWVLYVRALANLGRLDDAGRACVAALDQHRDHPELHYLHAVLVAQAGRYAESARAAKRAIYLDRAMIVAYLVLGSSLARSGDTAGALRAFAASERLLSALPADQLVPATDGEPAGRLLEMSRVQAALAAQATAA